MSGTTVDHNSQPSTVFKFLHPSTLTPHYGSESSTLETDVYIRQYVPLVVYVRNEWKNQWIMGEAIQASLSDWHSK